MDNIWDLTHPNRWTKAEKQTPKRKTREICINWAIETLKERTISQCQIRIAHRSRISFQSGRLTLPGTRFPAHHGYEMTGCQTAMKTKNLMRTTQRIYGH